MKHAKLLIILISVTCAALLLAFPDPAASVVRRIRGQSVYVPAYSHIYHGDREAPFYLTVTLSIRNTDPASPITLLSVQYFDTNGKLLTSYLEKEMTLRPMGSVDYVVKESDKKGGSGANFIVKWKSRAEVTEPIVETIMISTALQQGISFSSRGQAIEEQ
ncbi:MAG: DUF3124 domain-containing protein [Syntrophobacteraceae bacterium]